MAFDYSIQTRETLLERLKSADDHASWQDFFNTYWRLLYGFAVKAGLTEEEARDVVQDTVITVARNIPGFCYNPQECSFKTWLLNLTRWRIVDKIRQRRTSRALPTQGSEGGHAELDEIPDPVESAIEGIWDAEWEANLLDVAALRIKTRTKPKQYQMFYLHVLKQMPASKVAERLGTSLSSVYLARHVVGRMFRREVKLLQAESLR
jgi:RNA polymerase sigma factor (sigma-70 family)